MDWTNLLTILLLFQNIATTIYNNNKITLKESFKVDFALPSLLLTNTSIVPSLGYHFLFPLEVDATNLDSITLKGTSPLLTID